MRLKYQRDIGGCVVHAVFRLLKEFLHHLLGHIGRRYPVKDGRAVITRGPTHRELAEMVGSSRETVSRTLLAMQKEGSIEIDRRKITLLPEFFERERDRW